MIARWLDEEVEKRVKKKRLYARVYDMCIYAPAKMNIPLLSATQIRANTNILCSLKCYCVTVFQVRRRDESERERACERGRKKKKKFLQN